MDPLWPSNLPIYIVTDTNWPANTILGISKPNAIVLHESSTASYSSVENFVTRRSTKFRVDFERAQTGSMTVHSIDLI